jgi:hypothetical protein
MTEGRQRLQGEQPSARHAALPMTTFWNRQFEERSDAAIQCGAGRRESPDRFAPPATTKIFPPPTLAG